MASPSVNFAFLAAHDAALVAYAADAEAVFRGHPRLCVANLRTLAEALARHAAAYARVWAATRDELGLVLGRLRDAGIVDPQIAGIFRTLRESGNEAVHAGTPERPARVFTHGDARSAYTSGAISRCGLAQFGRRRGSNMPISAARTA